MAKPAWLSINPASGSGDGTSNVTRTAHTGRTQRVGVLTVKFTGASDKTVTLTQSGALEFVTINDIAAAKAGGNVTITGKSNSSKLTFALGSGDITLSLPGTYLAGGASTSNGVAITGDPGASAEYDFSVTFNVPANATTATKTRAITVTAAGGQSATANLSQAAGDATGSVTPETQTVDAAAGTITITLTSNTTWTIE